MNKLALLAPLMLALAACNAGPPEPPKEPVAPTPPAAPAEPAKTTSMDAAAFWSRFDTILAAEHRGDKHRARDQYRHPKETLQFFGLAPGMSVVEIWPGGTRGVVEHRAAAGKSADESFESGYISEDAVTKLATDAGFQPSGKSEVNANPKDTKDYAKGVWTLPPVLIEGDKDRDKYLAIGESDRMTLRFVKPK